MNPSSEGEKGNPSFLSEQKQNNIIYRGSRLSIRDGSFILLWMDCLSFAYILKIIIIICILTFCLVLIPTGLGDLTLCCSPWWAWHGCNL